MYSKNCTKFTINKARQSMFTHNLKSLDTYKRALLVAAYTWHDRLQQWLPFWTEFEDASNACAMLLHGGHKNLYSFL